MLGQGVNTFYLYDKGGTRQLGVFERTPTKVWTRTLDGISTAQITVTVPGDDADCADWLGQIRAWRHELVVFRDDRRVWEGPISRVVFLPGLVQVLARDVLGWMDRRSHRGRFTDPANGVAEVIQAVQDACTYDDPNVADYVLGYTDQAPLVTTAVNRHDSTYWDAIGDVLDQGVHVTAVGRAVVSWAAAAPISRTVTLESGSSLSADVSVIEDGLSLATRAINTGGSTYGATSPEPVIRNEATNPAVVGTAGYSGGKWFKISTTAASWAAGGQAGRASAAPPVKPASSASRAKKSAYDAAVTAYQQSDVLMPLKDQAVKVHPGEDLSATLEVRIGGSAARAGRVGLRLVGIDATGATSDRAFSSGPPIVLSAATQQLFVEGTVPDDTVKAFVEVYLDTNYIKPVLQSDGTPKPDSALTDAERTPVRWQAGDGILFSRLALFRGRIDPWFAGDTKDDATFRYDWTGGPNASASTRTALHPVPDAYYGLVEALERVPAITDRPGLEAGAAKLLGLSYPAPLTLDATQDAPLRPDAPVDIEELVPGAVVPVQSLGTAREVIAATILSGVKVEETDKGEKVSVTLTSGPAWESHGQPLTFAQQVRQAQILGRRQAAEAARMRQAVRAQGSVRRDLSGPSEDDMADD